MNVLITNRQENRLSSLDIDIIKHISGTFKSQEICDMFKTFFYNKMIIDITAIDRNKDIRSLETLANSLEADMIIIFLPENSEYCTTQYLSLLVHAGLYNFTTNLEGVRYLLKKTNTYEDVSHIQGIEPTGAEASQEAVTVGESQTPSNGPAIVIGIKSATEHAGATTLIYMMTKALSSIYGADKVLALELQKSDFKYFNRSNMVSTTENDMRLLISRDKRIRFALIDLNNSEDTSMCNAIIYLVEPSTLKLNKMIDRHRTLLDKLRNERVMLNNSLLSNKDVNDLEYESGLRFFYNMPPLNDRKNNEIIVDFLGRINLVQRPSGNEDKSIFGLFRR